MNTLLFSIFAVLGCALVALWAKGFRRQPPLARFAWHLARLSELFRPRAPYALANIAEGQNLNGAKTYTAVSTATVRYLIAKLGGTPLNADLAGQGDKPIGIFTDQPTAAIETAVNLLGAAPGTQKVAINSTVNDGDLLTSDTGGYARSYPSTVAGSYWIVGRATLPGATAGAGDTIEFIPCAPFLIVVVAALTSAQNATTAAVDLATSEALANSLKTSFNALQADVKALHDALSVHANVKWL